MSPTTCRRRPWPTTCPSLFGKGPALAGRRGEARVEEQGQVVGVGLRARDGRRVVALAFPGGKGELPPSSEAGCFLRSSASLSGSDMTVASPAPFKDLSFASASRRSAKKDARVPSASVNSGVLPSAVVMTKKGTRSADGNAATARAGTSSAPAVQAPMSRRVDWRSAVTDATAASVQAARIGHV